MSRFGLEIRDDGLTDLKFDTGIVLTGEGRRVLADYYLHKYQARIEFAEARWSEVPFKVGQLVAAARATTGDCRCAYYFGDDDDLIGDDEAHGKVVVFIREGADEALLLVDSIDNGDAEQLSFGAEVAEACASYSPGGNPLAIYQHVRRLQRDGSSCWLYAMNAATTLTGRLREDGGGYIVPDLIQSLRGRVLRTQGPAGVRLVWAIPEIARMSQDMKSLSANAGSDVELPLRGSKPGTTLRTFLEKYTYSNDGALTPDYIRQKGLRAAEIMDIWKWSQLIGEKVGAEHWDATRQDEFVAAMKAQLRAEPANDDIRDGIRAWQAADYAPTLGTLVASVESMLSRVKDSTVELRGAADLASLMKHLSPAGFEELMCNQDRACDLNRQLKAALAFHVSRLEQERRYDQSAAESTVMQGRVEALEVEMRRFDDLLAEQICEIKDARRDAHLSFLLRANPKASRVADAIESMACSSAKEFFATVSKLLTHVAETRPAVATLAAEKEINDVLSAMRARELVVLRSELDIHRELIRRLQQKVEDVGASIEALASGRVQTEVTALEKDLEKLADACADLQEQLGDVMYSS